MAHSCLDRPRAWRRLTAAVNKHLSRREAKPGDARPARITLTDAGRQSCDTLFPQIAATNARALASLDDATVQVLDGGQVRLTALATTPSRAVLCELGADHQAGGSCRVRDWPG